MIKITCAHIYTVYAPNLNTFFCSSIAHETKYDDISINPLATEVTISLADRSTVVANKVNDNQYEYENINLHSASSNTNDPEMENPANAENNVYINI